MQDLKILIQFPILKPIKFVFYLGSAWEYLYSFLKNETIDNEFMLMYYESAKLKLLNLLLNKYGKHSYRRGLQWELF